MMFRMQTKNKSYSVLRQEIWEFVSGKEYAYSMLICMYIHIYTDIKKNEIALFVGLHRIKYLLGTHSLKLDA